MIQVLGENYYVDLDEIENYIDTVGDENLNISGTSEQRVNVVKYELIKLMLDVVFTETELGDEKLGFKGTNNTSVPFKLAFNTLLNKKLIKHY
jgi:hypothetical protein